MRNFKLKCIVKDGSNTIKTSNEYYVEVVSTPPELPLFQKRDINEPTFPLAKEMEINSIPNEFSLDQNYPNPFNPSTRISYFLPEANFVTLKVYDILGNEIATLVNESKPSGKFEVEFNGSNLSTGTYIYTLTSGNYQTIRKMLLIK